MPTPLTPDEEFDARFRRGLADHPALLPADEPAAWRRMQALLDGADRRAVLRRRVLRAFGLEVLLVALVLWLGLRGLPAGPAAVADAGEHRAATAQPATGPAPAAKQRPAAGTTAPAAAAAPTAPLAMALETENAVPPDNVSPAQPSGQLAASRQQRSPQTGSVRALPGAWAANATPPAQTRRLRPESADQLAGRVARARRPAAAVAIAPAGRRSRRPRLGARRDEATGQNLAAANGGALLAAPSHRRRKLTEHPSAPGSAAELGARNAAAANAGEDKAVAATKSAGQPAPVNPLAALGLGSGFFGRRPDSLAGVALAVTSWPVDSLPRPEAPLAAAYRLRLGLVAAPELSGVRAERLSPPGGNVGVQLDYQLARRWRLSTGYLLALKRYAARGSDYHPPAGYWPGTWTVERVDADCRIIDVPLNLRYDLWQRPRHQIFASAGLSSLFMRREDYTYTYEVAGQPRTADWELLNGSRHVLQILNLSAGYERALGQRWSVQAEPFVKLPLGGVGFGAVRLSSAGVFFSFKYGLLPRVAAPPAAP